MNRSIIVPNVSRDKRIGSVFNHLFSFIRQYEWESENDNAITLDFSGTQFFHPFFLFPFSIYLGKTERKPALSNIPPYIRSYLGLVRFFDMLKIEDDDSLKAALNSYERKSYIPVCRFSRKSRNIDSMQTIIQTVIEKQKNLDTRLKTPLSYLTSELICNISQHSKSEYGYIYSQYLSSERSLDLCIADDGITVYGSYVKSGRFIDEIGGNEAVALYLANEGFSTKNLPNAENRGFGLSTTKSMIVDGLGGAFFMLSGNAFHRYDEASGKQYIKLPEDINWRGTIVLLRIPLKVRSTFRYEDYIK